MCQDREAGNLLGFVGLLKQLGEVAGTCPGGTESHGRVMTKGGAGSALCAERSFWGQVWVALEAKKMERGGSSGPR